VGAASPEPTPAAGGLVLPPRSPRLAAVYSALALGSGQVHNHQLEKAILFWLWGALHLGAGAGLLFLGLLGRWVPPAWARPPLGDWVADHAGAVVLGWLCAGFLLWAASVRDAARSARAINEGRVQVQYSMRRQLAHVLGAQLLGLVPFVGMLFPAGVVAEALDAARERRRLDTGRLAREGSRGLAEWLAVKVACWGLAAFWVAWGVWWILRAFRVAP